MAKHPGKPRRPGRVKLAGHGRLPKTSRGASGSFVRRSKPAVQMCVPAELAGKWVAWSRDGRLLAYGDTLDEVTRKADKERLVGERVSYEWLDPIPAGPETVGV